MVEIKSPQSRRYEVDGLTVDIPLCYDEMVNRYLEYYPDFKKEPVYTPDGHPLTVCVDDACQYGEMTEPVQVPDCGTCKYYRKAAEHTLFGVCDHELRRITPKEEARI